jgi:5-methylthioadenosine/S-adenosylhomocysteine deaminase
MTDAPLDILIRNGLVLTMDPARTVIAAGAVAIQGDRITAVGEEAAIGTPNARMVIDAGGGIIMPGLVNTHTHAAMTLFRGLADDVPLMSWLNDHIFPAEATLDHRRVYCGALLACAEMIMSGTTTFCDMYLFEDAVAQAVRTAGMRAVVGEVLFDFPSPHYGALEQGLAYTATLIETYRNDPLITVAVEPHSPYLCAPELLKRACELAGRHHLPLAIHLAETQEEVQTIRRR